MMSSIESPITGSLDFNADIFVFTGHGDYSDEYDDEENNNIYNAQHLKTLNLMVVVQILIKV